jgi:hypothetical protein
VRQVRRLALVLVAAGLTTGVAFAAAGDPVQRHTPADMQKARAALLRVADLGPGWKAVAVNDDSDCRAFRPDESDLVETGMAERVFLAGGSRVGSSAEVFRTEAHALASWRRTVKADALRCALEGLRNSLPRGARATTVRLGRLAFPQLAPRTTAFRLVVRLTGIPNGPVLLYTDAVLLGRGRTIAALLTGNPREPVPAKAEGVLAGLIARRMR